MSQASTEPGGPQVRPFSEFLLQQARGATHSELSVALHDLIADVRDTGKAGSLTLKVDIKPVNKSDGRQLIVAANVTVKPPTTEAPTSVFFVDKAGNLSRTDPDQLSFGDLREVEDRREGQEPKEVAR